MTHINNKVWGNYDREMKILSKSSEKTFRLGEELGRKLHGGQVVALYGDLGGGKTQFTKGIARGLGIKDEIISPTFVVRREYEMDSRRSLSVGEIPASQLRQGFAGQTAGMTKESENDKEGGVIRKGTQGRKLNLLHYDFYRFEKPDEELLETLNEGINPDNVTVIEWAERVERYLPEDTVKIIFHYVSEDEREIDIKNIQYPISNDQSNPNE